MQLTPNFRNSVAEMNETVKHLNVPSILLIVFVLILFGFLLARAFPSTEVNKDDTKGDRKNPN